MTNTLISHVLSKSFRSASMLTRSFHSSKTRQAIVMPTLSPFMTEGTITRWRKKEGEAFNVGDVLLEIVRNWLRFGAMECEDEVNLRLQENDVTFLRMDICAELPGTLWKILHPDGSANIPTSQTIALVQEHSDGGDDSMVDNTLTGNVDTVDQDHYEPPVPQRILLVHEADRGFASPLKESASFATHVDTGQSTTVVEEDETPSWECSDAGDTVHTHLLVIDRPSDTRFSMSAMGGAALQGASDGHRLRRMIASGLSDKEFRSQWTATSGMKVCNATQYFDGIA